ncbi:transmembrane protein 25 isoform X2 [Phalacrocorax carbo]|uniref:transmembrane protein 25 isoform X2 n=1 Tax=Phalacrocorax carbo TaxID=9209 RepID=UPI003119C658
MLAAARRPPLHRMHGPARRGPGAELHCGLGWTQRQRCSSAERGRCVMGHPGGWLGAAITRLLLLLGVPVLCSAGLGEPGPTIDGQLLAECTLREEESRAFTCRAPRTAPGAALAWYLDGQKQEANCLAAGTASTLTLTARRSDRELNCSLIDPASGDTYNASVLLDVQYKPEILQAEARYQEVEGAGLLLLLSVLVQANPPASITWVDQDGRVMANASEFLLLGTTRYPGLANHSLRVHLGSTAGNFSISAANSVGVTTASLLPPGLLDARVELPLLGVAVGAALALGALLSLGSCAACLACRRAEPVPGKGQAGGSSPLSRCSPCSGSEHLQPRGARLPRQTRSLPPDLRLGDLAQEPGASPRDVGAGAREEEIFLPGLENSLVLSKLGEGVQGSSSSRRPGVSTKCRARAAMRSGCEPRCGAPAAGLPTPSQICPAASTAIPPVVRPSTSLALAGPWPACSLVLSAPARAAADGWAGSMAAAVETARQQ